MYKFPIYALIDKCVYAIFYFFNSSTNVFLMIFLITYHKMYKIKGRQICIKRGKRTSLLLKLTSVIVTGSSSTTISMNT